MAEKRGRPVRTGIPVHAISLFIELLLETAAKAKTEVPATGVVKIDRVLKPTAMMLVKPAQGAGSILRIQMGHATLDFALEPGLARVLETALAATAADAPQKPS